MKVSWLLSMLLLSGLSFSTGHLLSFIQDTSSKNDETEQALELIDRDGRRIKARVTVIGKQDSEKVLASKAQDSGKVDISGEVTITNGVVKKRLPDGTEQVIQPQSVVITQSQRTTVADNEEKTERVHRAIVIDHEGNRYEIDIQGQPDNLIVGNVVSGVQIPNVPAPPMIFSQSQAGKYMIGISVEPVTRSLASELNLDPDVGLIVTGVVPNSPAASAGLQADDVLLYANEIGLSLLEDLTKMVQEAGAADQAFSLIIVRDGQELSVELKPEARSTGKFEFRFSDVPGENADGLLQMLQDRVHGVLTEIPDVQLDWQQFGPGIVLDGENFDPEALRERFAKIRQEQEQRFEEMRQKMLQKFDIEEHRIQVEEMTQQAKQHAKELAEQARKQAAEMETRSRQQIQELMEQIRVLREEVERLKRDR